MPPQDPKLKAAPVPERAEAVRPVPGFAALPGVISKLTERVEAVEARVERLELGFHAVGKDIASVVQVELRRLAAEAPPVRAVPRRDIAAQVATAGAEGLLPAPKPWEVLGISRSLYFLRKKEGKL